MQGVKTEQPSIWQVSGVAVRMFPRSTLDMAPLTTRPLDILYTAFFYVHIPATLLINGQYFYPPDLVPRFLSQLLEWNHQLMRDPLVGGISQKFAPGSQELDWFKSFTFVEFFFQLPVFIVGARGLRNGQRQ